MQDGTINTTNTLPTAIEARLRTTSVGARGLYEFVAVTGDHAWHVDRVRQSRSARLRTLHGRPLRPPTAGTKALSGRPRSASTPRRTAAGITAPAWDFGIGATGETGGVAVHRCRDTLTLATGTSVEGQPNRAFFLAGKGFRGGAGVQSTANGPNTDLGECGRRCA